MAFDLWVAAAAFAGLCLLFCFVVAAAAILAHWPGRTNPKRPRPFYYPQLPQDETVRIVKVPHDQDRVA